MRNSCKNSKNPATFASKNLDYTVGGNTSTCAKMFSKKRLKFSLLLALFVLVLPLATLLYCGNLQVNSVVSAQTANMCYYQSGNLEGCDSESKFYKNFTHSNQNVYNAFVGQKVELSIAVKKTLSNAKIECDAGIAFKDGTQTLTSGVDAGNDFMVYSKTIYTQTAGEYSLTLLAWQGDVEYFDSLTLCVYDKIESIEMEVLDDFVTNNQNVTINFNYNSCKEIAVEEELTLTIDDGQNVSTVTTADFATVTAINSFNTASVTINTAQLPSNTKAVTLTAKMQGKVAKTRFNVQPLTYPTSVELQSNTITYYLHDGIGEFGIYMDKNSKPIIEIVDNDGVVSLASIKKAESDRSGLDKVVLTFNLLSTTSYTNVLLKITGEAGQIYKVAGVRIIDEIKSVRLSEQKQVYDNKSGVNIQAIVNGYDDYASSVEWFVDDLKISTTDAVLDFVAKGGTYNVYAEVQGVKSDTVTFTVKYSRTNVMIWYIVLALCIVAIIVLYLTRKKKGKVSLFGTISENIEEVLAGVKELDAKFTQKGARKLLRNFTIVKERLWHAYEENEEQLYGQANKAMQTAYKQMRKLTGKCDEAKRKEIINIIIEKLNNANDALLEYKRLCNINKYQAEEK